MCSICSCQLSIWQAGHCLAPILNWFNTSRAYTEARFSWLTYCTGLTLPSGTVHPKILNTHYAIYLKSLKMSVWRDKWAWWIARTAITCPKNLRHPSFTICILRPWSNLGGLRKRTNFVEPIQRYELLKSRWCQNLSLIERGAKNEIFKIFGFFLFKWFLGF